jgi:hypothetical protein
LEAAELSARMAAQGWRCANEGCRAALIILDVPARWDRIHVDHNHVTGVVRGCLCGSCNKAIGLLRDDSARLFGAAAYVGGF